MCDICEAGYHTVCEDTRLRDQLHPEERRPPMTVDLNTFFLAVIAICQVLLVFKAY